MFNANKYRQPRTWWDPWAVVGVGAAMYALLSLWPLPCLHPSVWGDVAVAAGLRPPANPFPGLYRLIVGALFECLPAGRALDALPYLGRLAVSASALFVYLVFRDMLPTPLRVQAHMVRLGGHVGRLAAFLAALLFTCSDPVWRAGQTFSPVSLFLLQTTGAGCLFFRFVRTGSIYSLYGCCAVLGMVCADATLGFALTALVAAGVSLSIRSARDPDAPPVNPLVDGLVRAVVFRRLSYVWTFFFVLAVGTNVWRFVVQDGLAATGHQGVPGLLFEYFRGVYEATRGAATGPGWLFILLLALAPFVFAIRLLPRAWDDDRFLPWGVGVVYALIGVVALSQLAGASKLWFWTWMGPRRTMVDSDMLLACVLLLDVVSVVFALAVFGVDAICRNYRRIARQHYPDAVLESASEQMTESLGRTRVWRKRIFGMLVCAVPLLVVPGRILSTERGMARIISESAGETLREAEGCEMIFTDGAFDELLELEALRLGRPTVCLSLMAANTPRERMIRQRMARDDEDRALLETDAASALRSWVATKPERLGKSAVQVGFELWRRARRPLPAILGFVAVPGGVTDAARLRARDAYTEIGDAAFALAQRGDVEFVADRALRRKFPFVLWRLSRLAQMRSRVADEAGNRAEAFREAARADELDAVNAQVQKMRQDMDWLKKQNGGQLSPREGLVIGLARADFALAGRYAAPVLRADPDEPRANFAMGMMFYQDERYSCAERYLVRCLKRRPDEPAVLNNLAIVQIKLGKLDDAEANVRRALAKCPNLAEIQKTLARVCAARQSP